MHDSDNFTALTYALHALQPSQLHPRAHACTYDTVVITSHAHPCHKPYMPNTPLCEYSLHAYNLLLGMLVYTQS